jgi:hypothetical protein
MTHRRWSEGRVQIIEGRHVCVQLGWRLGVIAVCKTLGTAATSLLFEHNARARVFGLFLDNHCMDPLHSLIKSEPFYYMQVLVTKKKYNMLSNYYLDFCTLLERFLNCCTTMRRSFAR